MLKKLIFIALFFISIISGNTFSQTEIPAFDFLRVDPGAKASSLAGAFDTYTDDPNVMFRNIKILVGLVLALNILITASLTAQMKTGFQPAKHSAQVT